MALSCHYDSLEKHRDVISSHRCYKFQIARTRAWPWCRAVSTANKSNTVLLSITERNYIIACIAFKIKFSADKIGFRLIDATFFVVDQSIRNAFIAICLAKLRYYSFHAVTQTNNQFHHISFYYSNFDLVIFIIFGHHHRHHMKYSSRETILWAFVHFIASSSLFLSIQFPSYAFRFASIYVFFARSITETNINYLLICHNK